MALVSNSETVPPAVNVLWLIVPASVAAWAFMLFAPADMVRQFCFPPRVEVTGLALDRAYWVAQGLFSWTTLASNVLMAFAMAWPLWLQPMCQIMWRSFFQYRWLNTCVWLVSATVTWVSVSALLFIFAHALHAGLSAIVSLAVVPVIAALVAATFRVSKTGKNAVVACHRTHVLAAFAPVAQFDAGKAGTLSALTCLNVCLPGMFAMWVSSYPITAMAIVSLTAAADRYQFRPSAYRAALALATIALLEV